MRQAYAYDTTYAGISFSKHRFQWLQRTKEYCLVTYVVAQDQSQYYYGSGIQGSSEEPANYYAYRSVFQQDRITLPHEEFLRQTFNKIHRQLL